MVNKFIGWSRRKNSAKRKIFGLIIGGFLFLVAIPLLIAVSSAIIDRKLAIPGITHMPFNLVASIFLSSIGLFFIIWSGFAQIKIGKGTPVPMVPTEKLVTSPPYTFCRNPMLLGSVLYYLGISFWLNSLSAMALTLFFLLLSTVYIKLVEEKELLARFGKEYEDYRRKTPFIIPRFRRGM